jgi:hypothetical protein
MKTTIALALMIPTFACAEFFSGADLLARMKGDQADRLLATGYVMGVFDSHQNATNCAPNGMISGELAATVQKYLETLPAPVMRSSADMILSAAFEKAWPCGTRL